MAAGIPPKSLEWLEHLHENGPQEAKGRYSAPHWCRKYGYTSWVWAKNGIQRDDEYMEKKFGGEPGWVIRAADAGWHWTQLETLTAKGRALFTRPTPKAED